MIKLQKLNRDEKGLILITIVLVVSFLMIIGFALLSATSNQFSIAQKNAHLINSVHVAEAGVERSLQELNTDDNFAGYPSEQEFFNNATQGRGVYTVTISDSPNDSDAKVITSTGKVYRYNSSKLISTRIVKVTAVGTQSEGYSVATGPGGLILGGSASITNSNVYVNGFITMNGASKIGTSSQPVNVNVAHQSCPTGNNPGPTYPQLCTSGQPISLAHSTNIYGTVCATNQTSTGPNNNIQPGNGGQGLVPGCTAPTVSLPTYDKAAHVAAVTTTGAGNSNTYVCNSWPFNRTWPANLKLTGNVSIGGSCNVVITGDVYITGDLTLNGAARISVADSLGTTRPNIIVDGKITVGGSANLLTNSSGTGAQFISFKSTAGCNPNCTSLSGNDLKTSSGTETVDVGGAASLPGMILYAYWGKISLDGSGNMGSAIGQTIDMTGAGTITFGTTLSAGSRTWTISSYQQKYPGQP